MRFETSQHLRLGQQMKLAPRMIQSMEILQMPLAELEERIEQELESNATLELVDGEPGADASATSEATDLAEAGEGEGEGDEGVGEEGGDDASPLDAVEGDEPAVTVDEGSATDDFERLDSYEDANPEAAENEFSAERHERAESEEYRPVTRYDGETDAKSEAMAATPARAASLIDQLRGQWALTEVLEELRPLGELVISFLDDDGYLRTPLETIAERAAVGDPSQAPPGGHVFAQRPSPAELERALRAVQLLLEPAGVAARDPRECLLLQLDALEEEATDIGWPRATLVAARTLVDKHLDDLLQNRLPRVAEKTGLSMGEIKEAMTLMRRLSLAPARRLVSEDVRPIVPDAIVEYNAEQDRYLAYLNERSIPNLRINEEYARLAKDKEMERKDRDFIKTNLGNAQWLIDAVEQRKRTLLRVVRAVVDAQREFFDYGPQALKPLPMTQVAEQLGIHVATVSRAVAEKYLATPRGIVPLRKFFSGGLQTTGEDGASESMAWDAIKVALREVIGGEDKATPLSDESLVDEMKKRGIDIARRTVAKYRDQLGIPTARLRKTF